MLVWAAQLYIIGCEDELGEEHVTFLLPITTAVGAEAAVAEHDNNYP